MTELKDFLTINVLEKYVADMILDDVMDMEEIVIDNIHIRKTHQKNFKIYDFINKRELFINTSFDYITERMKNGHEYYAFVQEFLRIMREKGLLEEDFIKEILTKLFIYSYRNLKSTLKNYIWEEDISSYIELGINDSVEDVIYQSQFDNDIQEHYKDYEFNYKPWQVIIEEEDLVDLQYPDEEWRRENNIQVGDDLNMDGLIVSSDSEEIERFKTHLKSTGDLIAIEELSIIFYLKHIIYPYEMDYMNLVAYILEEVEDETDEEEDEVLL